MRYLVFREESAHLVRTKNRLASTHLGITSGKVAGGILSLLIAWLGFKAELLAQEPVLIIESVDDHNFPYVATTVAVSPSNAVPGDAQPLDFVVEEGGGQPAQVISTTTTTLDTVQVVLALDISYLTPEVGDFDDVQEAATAFVESLLLSDQRTVSLLAFGDQVQQRETFTNDAQTLIQRIASLRPAGKTTALHQVIKEAIGQLPDQTATRQAVVIVSNRYDNTAGQGLEDKCGPADEIGQIETVVQTQKIPVFLIVFGDCAQPESRYDALLRSAGGSYEAVAQVEQVKPELESLSRRLQRAYRLTFLSERRADPDEKPQEFGVSTTLAGAAITGRAQFIPRPGQLTLETSLQEGQTVGGLTPITVTVTGPAPKVRAISFSFDGQELAGSDPKLEAAFPQQVGPHQMTDQISLTLTSEWVGLQTMMITATDSAENRVTEIVALNVVEPVQVSLSPIPLPAAPAADGWQARLERWGPAGLSDCLTFGPNCLWTPTKIQGAGAAESYNSSTVTFTHIVTSLHPIQREELLLDNQAVDDWSIAGGTLLDEKVYESTHEPEFTVTLSVTDALGQSGQANLVVRRPGINSWLKHLFDGLAIVAGLLTLYLIIKGSLAAYGHLFQRQRRRLRQEYLITLKNCGNVPCRYRLWATDQAEALEFEFDLVPAATDSQSRQAAQPQRAALSDTHPKSTPTPYVAVSAGSGGGPPVSRPAPAISSAGRLADWITAGVGQAAQALQTIVGVLPHSWAGSLARPSQTLHQGQIHMARAQQSAQRVRQASAQLGEVGSSLVRTSADSSPAEAQTQPASPPPKVIPTRPDDQAPKPAEPKHDEPHPAKDVTAYLRSGQSLEVTLHATPKDPYRVGRYLFSVHSVDFDHPAAAEPPPRSAEAGVDSISWFQRCLPVIQVLSVAAPLVLLLSLLTLQIVRWDVFGLLWQWLLM